MSKDGAVFLWYPGNRVVVVGRWAIESYPNQPGAARICFQYGANTFNPATGRGGGSPNCFPAGLLSRLVIDRAGGDVFGLSRSQTPPFVLTPQRTSIAELRARIGAR